MKIKKLLKIFGLLILAGNIVNAEYIKRNGEIYYRDWSEEKTRILKYIDKKLFDKIQNYSNINSSPEEKTQEMFLDEL